MLLAALEREGWFEGEDRPARKAVSPEPAQRGVIRSAERDTTQSHIVLGTDTFSIGDPRRFAMSILVNALGGGMSSRLFQRVREELGLAYAVYAYNQFHQGTGQLGIYVGTQPGSAEAALEAIQQELRRMAGQGLDEAELLVGKRQLQGQLMLALESPGARMSRLANFTLHREPYRTLDTIIQEIEAVPAAQVAAVAAEFLDPGATDGADAGTGKAVNGETVKSERGPVHRLPFTVHLGSKLNSDGQGHAHRRTEGNQDERESRRPGAGGRRGAHRPGTHGAARAGRRHRERVRR